MPAFEYKICPAPLKGKKAPGVKTPEARFAHTIEAFVNSRAAEGWEYIRSDILPSEERQGLTSSQTVYRTLMVFRRPVEAALSTADVVMAEAPSMVETAPEGSTSEPRPEAQTQDTEKPDAPEVPTPPARPTQT
ncbi:DUF4177 domain-containing protein [Roseovarius sp. LXJ103]|uniref:hypothetical protein n=1 Tax=Roseovarius carneus TaxID=2853164 RepID=UPI000D61CB48|nr:hypothetical protein [Roseovarius carneus]MBZ8119017.1 DUF4177 domain-containing protein [Roseovarius carneus]PWE35333.1 hypothetical protein DD563_04755 [Pelagicola sp. LXJ1103]